MHLPLICIFILLECSYPDPYIMHRVLTDEFVMTTNHIYRKTDKLGTGASSDVFKGIEKASGSLHALKVFKDSDWSRSYENFREIEALTRLSHKNIVGFYGREEERGTGRGVIVVEYCSGGSLYSYLQEPENIHGLDDKECLIFLQHTCQGLKYLREMGFVHRDIKPGNILRHISSDGSVTYKLSDFGASKRVDDSQGEFMSLAGTEEYLHPAMFEKAFIDRGGRMVFNESVDMWSLGATIYHACAGEIPFKPYDGVRQNRSIMFLMITCKPAGHIAGHQSSIGGDIKWRRSFPDTCHLSTSLQQKMTFIIAGLLEADQCRQWTFQTFEREVQMLMKMDKIDVINTNEGIRATMYIPHNPSLSTVKEAVACLTDVPASSQILLYKDRPLEEILNHRGFSFHGDSDDYIVLISRDDQEDEKHIYRSLDQCPVLGNRKSLDQDVKYSIKVCMFVHDLLRLSKDILLVTQAQRRAEAALWSQLRLLLLKMDKKFKGMKDLLIEKQSRLQTISRFEKTRETISREANSSISHRLKQAEIIMKQIRQSLRSFINELTKLSSDINTIEELSLPNNCHESIKRLESYFEECKSIWRAMRKRRQLAPLNEHEELVHKRQRGEIEELCSRSLSEWRGCFLQAKNLSSLHFNEKRSKYFTYFDKLHALEEQLVKANKNGMKFSELIIQIEAFTGGAWSDVTTQMSKLHQVNVTTNLEPSLSTTASSGYSSMELRSESSSISSSLNLLIEDLPIVEVFSFEDT